MQRLIDIMDGWMDEFIRRVGIVRRQCVKKGGCWASIYSDLLFHTFGRYRHYAFEHHLTGVYTLAKNSFLGDKFMFLPLPIPI